MTILLDRTLMRWVLIVKLGDLIAHCYTVTGMGNGTIGKRTLACTGELLNFGKVPYKIIHYPSYEHEGTDTEWEWCPDCKLISLVDQLRD